MRGERDSFRQKADSGGFNVSFSGPSTSSGPFRLFICSSVGDLEPFDFTRDPEVLEGRKRHREAVARCLLSQNGSPGRTRTADKVVNSHSLYQLSYRGV